MENQIIQSGLTINISTTVAIIVITVFVFGLGVAWATLKSDVKSIKKEFGKNGILNKIKHNLQAVCAALMKYPNIDFDSAGLQTFSPVTIIPEGYKKIEDSGFDVDFEKNKEKFLNFIKTESPTTDYDIESLSIRAVYYFMLEKDVMNLVKDYLYNNPEKNKKELFFLFGIYVRDKYNESLK